MSEPIAGSSWWKTLGWAVYLGVSWTWCIGMFLPALLNRDFGIWSFAVFAAPNVVGAAGLGWVLRNGSAERLRQDHAIACAAFSVVTILFQVFFLGWFVFRIFRTTGGYSTQYPWVLLLTVATIAISALTWTVLRRRSEVWLFVAALVVLGVSVGAGVILLKHGVLDFWQSRQVRALPQAPLSDLALLAPVCLFGFALCPYLDLTFLRARDRQNRLAARVSFTVGFGVLFFSMILLTLAYAPMAIGLTGFPIYHGATETLLLALGIHLFLQLIATVLFHADELLRLPRPLSRNAIACTLGLMLLVAMACLYTDWQVITRLSMLQGEVIYRLFMSFYGLVFPAYVWLCMIPSRDGHSGIAGPIGSRKLTVLGVAVALAAPCYWMGFIERVEWWLVPGLGVVLLARLLVRGRGGVAVAG